MSSDAQLKHVAEIMTRLAEDTSVPRNIRRAASGAKETVLKKEGEPVVKAASARITLEEISNDPNMPVHARTMIWNALSILETIRE
ncbi:MAG TPA: UPF0147 family protein [Hadesarchaea archaeon]|nr:UPF0147 family protein [Hadesarchaea archaeon]